MYFILKLYSNDKVNVNQNVRSAQAKKIQRNNSMSQAEESLACYGFIKFPYTIAAKVGINEAFVLAVLDKWINYHKSKELNREKKPHFIDNRWATYITIDELQKQIQVVSEKPIRNAVKHLCKEGIVIVSHHSRGAYRRTNWYSIDYDRLALLVGDQEDDQILETVDSTETRKDKTKILEVVDSTGTTSLEAVDSTGIEAVDSTESYIRINTLDNINTLEELNSCSFQNQEHGKSREKLFDYLTIDLNAPKVFANTVISFLENYTLNGYGTHPNIPEENILKIYDEFYNAEERNKGIVDENWEYMIKEYFSQNFNEKCDHRIFHFFSPGVLDNLYHHIADRAG